MYLRDLNKNKIFEINGEDKTLQGYALITLNQHQDIIKQGIQDYYVMKDEKEVKLADIEELTVEVEEGITNRNNEIQKVLSYIK
ncbi:hypothetical protein AN1V17_10740 [Vallitalea sediminicola]